MRGVTVIIRGEKVRLSGEEARDVFHQLRPSVLAEEVRIAVEDEGSCQGLSKKKIKECAKSLAEDIGCIMGGYFDDAVSYAVQEYV